MLIGREMAKVFNKFIDPIKGSMICQTARVSVEMPSGELFDVRGVFLAENKILGARETHRIVIQVQPEVAPPGDVMKKKGDIVMS